MGEELDLEWKKEGSECFVSEKTLGRNSEFLKSEVMKVFKTGV
jgi:hypothetical protein